MPGPLDHSPADITRWLLVSLGLGSDPNLRPLQAWPIYAGNEPDSPDECITVYNAVSSQGGRTHYDGERQEHHGIQVRVRARTDPVGYAKLKAIAIAVDQDVYQAGVTVGGVSYLVHCFSQTGGILSLGTEVQASKRMLFVFNTLVSLRKVS